MYRVFFMKKRLFCVIVCILLLTSAVMIRMTRFYSEACATYAQSGVKAEISNKLNSIIIEELATRSIEYSQFAKIEYLSNGKAGLITVDTIAINSIATEISIKLTDEIKEAQSLFGIPFGNTVGITYLAGKGPKINVTITPVGYTKYEINSQLISGGINQTVHRISIDFSAEIECVAPFNKEIIIVESSVVLAETVIIGDVPQILIPSA